MKLADIVVKEIFLRVDGGLGNRIRPVLSALFMGHKLQAPVTFEWALGKGCRCPVNELFEPRVKWASFDGAYLHYRNNRPEFGEFLEKALRTEPVLKLKSPEYFETFHRYFPGEAETWIAANIEHYFVPQAPLMNKILVFAQKHALSEALGVHVRRGDKVGRVRDLPTLEAYFQTVDQELAGDAPIFLATDDGRDADESDILRKFSRRYGKRIVYRRKAGLGRGQVGTQDALVDLWLLRSCGSFIGAKCSTYSETAALGRPASLISMRKSSVGHSGLAVPFVEHHIGKIG